jgi:ketosteroid isomerase-like protein
MRKILLPLFAIILLAGTSCKTETNIEKEQEAILEALYQQSEAFISGDLEEAFAVHTQDPLETRLEMGPYSYNVLKGWDEIKSFLEDAAPGFIHSGAVNTKENVIMKVMGNCAWLTCDNIWKWDMDGGSEGVSNIQVVFLEKIKGEWKISFSSYYNKAVPVAN